MSEGVESALRHVAARAERDPEVFGSRARGEAGPQSDLDLCLGLEEGVPTGHAASRKRLDYIAGSDIDLSIFQQLPLYVRSRVLKEGHVVFVRDEDRLYAIAVRISWFTRTGASTTRWSSRPSASAAAISRRSDARS